jgi:holliday junction resolvase YEN1
MFCHSSNLPFRRGIEDATHRFDMLLYDRGHIESHLQLGLTPADLAFVALLSGGDYSVSWMLPPGKQSLISLLQEGLKSFGVKISSQLARAGFGRRLIDGVRGRTADSCRLFLEGWRQDLRIELIRNTSGRLSCCHPALASNIPGHFPDLDILALYLHPSVHRHNLAAQPPLTFSSGLQPVALARLASSTFQWGREPTSVFKRYQDVLFPAMALREVIQGASDIASGRFTAGPNCCPMIGRVVGQRNKTIYTELLVEVRVLLNVPSALIDEICSVFKGVNQAVIAQIKKDCKKCRAWLPRAMVEVARPDLFVGVGIGGKSKIWCYIITIVRLTLLVSTQSRHRSRMSTSFKFPARGTIAHLHCPTLSMQSHIVSIPFP